MSEMHIFRRISQNIRRICALVAICFLITTFGCSHMTAEKHYQSGLDRIQRGEWEKASKELQAAREKESANVLLKMSVDRAYADIAAHYANEGVDRYTSGDFSDAEALFRSALNMDPANALAQDGLRMVDRRKKAQGLFETAQTLDLAGRSTEALQLYRESRKLNPDHVEAADRIRALTTLDADVSDSLDQPVSFNFENVDLIYIFRSLAAVSDMNVLVDQSLTETIPVSVELKNITVKSAMDDLAKTYGILNVSLNNHTILLAEDTPENRNKYMEDHVRLFQLRYADCDNVKEIVAPLIPASVVLSDQRLNAVLVRCNSENMKLAEHLIAAMDIRESEAMVELQVLEIKRDKLQELGVSLGSDPAVRIAPGSELRATNGTQGKLNLSELNEFSSGNLFITMPSMYLDLLKTDAHTRILAQPCLKILNRVPAKLHIGDKVPVKTTTSKYRNTSEETSTYEYRDVGILMEITPRIISGKELAMDLRLEISSIVSENETGHPTIGTREITTTLRLRDNETEVIAGLIRDEERQGVTKVPLLGDIPILGRLFSSVSENFQQTDIVIALTPHLLDKLSLSPSSEDLWHGILTQSKSPSPYNTGRSNINDSVSRHSPVSARPDTPATTSGSTPDDTSAVPDSASDADAAEVFFDPSNSNLEAGNSTVVTVRIRNGFNVAAVPFYVEYDPEIIEIGEIEEGNYLSGDGVATAFLSSNDSEQGRLIIGISRLGASNGVSGDGELMSMEIIGIATGDTVLHFTHQSVKNPSAANIPSTFKDGSVSVN